MAALRISAEQWALLKADRSEPRPKIRKPRAALPENVLERQICDFCVLRGWLPIRIQAGVFRSLDGKRYISGAKKGTPDWIFARRDQCMLIEAKAPGGRVSAEQADFSRLAAALHLRYCMPHTLEEFTKWYYEIWRDLQ